MSAAKDSVAGDVVVAAHDRLVATRTGIDTRGEPVVYLRNDAAIARSEGFAALARIRVRANGHAIDATLFTVSGPRCMLAPGQVGLSEAAFSALDVEEGAALTLSHAPAVESLGFCGPRSMANGWMGRRSTPSSATSWAVVTWACTWPRSLPPVQVHA